VPTLPSLPPLKHRLACRVLELTQKLSMVGAWRWAGVMTKLLYPFNSDLKRTIQNNIAKTLPDQNQPQLAKQCFRHTLAFGLEAGSVWMKPLEYAANSITKIHGLALLQQAQASGKGVLILLPHLGNWEMANQFIAPRAKVVALYKPHQNQQLEHYIYTARCRAGVSMVPTNRRGVAQILRHLKSGGVTVILPDQVPESQGSSVLVPFFGHAAHTATLVPKLAKSSGAVLLGLVCARDEQGAFEVHISSAPSTIADNDLTLAATAMNSYIESLVRQFPAQYQWSYKRFKTIPGGTNESNHNI